MCQHPPPMFRAAPSARQRATTGLPCCTVYVRHRSSIAPRVTTSRPGLRRSICTKRPPSEIGQVAIPTDSRRPPGGGSKAAKRKQPCLSWTTLADSGSAGTPPAELRLDRAHHVEHSHLVLTHAAEGADEPGDQQ